MPVTDTELSRSSKAEDLRCYFANRLVMQTRRTVLAGVATTITLAGCSQQSSQPTEEQTGEANIGEFSLEEFRVDGNPPSEYDAQFIAGASPDAAADEFSPQFSYTITGTSNQVETELHVTHSPETIPKEELDETRKGETHSGAGAYQQNIALPDAVIEMFAETPRNLQATFKATDVESDQTKTRTFEMNYGNSYVEQAIEEGFKLDRLPISNTKFESLTLDNNTINISYESEREVGTLEFDRELAGIGGFYTSVVEDVRKPYLLEISVEDVDGEIYQKKVDNVYANEYLNGEITSGEFGNRVSIEELMTSN